MPAGDPQPGEMWRYRGGSEISIIIHNQVYPMHKEMRLPERRIGDPPAWRFEESWPPPKIYFKCACHEPAVHLKPLELPLFLRLYEFVRGAEEVTQDASE